MRFLPIVDPILSRRSIRRYEEKEILEEILNQILEAGRNAPSAANMQPIHFIVLKDNEIKKEIIYYL